MCINNQQNCMNMQSAIANFAQNIGQNTNQPQFQPAGNPNYQFPQNTPLQQVTQPQQNISAQQPPVNNTSSNVVTEDDIKKLLDKLRPQEYTAPVKIVEPSYLISESQLKELLGIKDSPIGQKAIQNINAQQAILQPQYSQYPNNYPSSYPVPGYTPMNCSLPKESNTFDSLANATLGTVGRIGHTFTELANNVIDILTLGYGK